MSIQLPGTIQSYIEASNRHDVPSILTCFDKEAIVRDENQTRRGLPAIEAWVGETIDKYKFQFTPLSLREQNAEYVVTIEVSGTFPNSPIKLDYHFGVANDKIQSLMIDS